MPCQEFNTWGWDGEPIVDGVQIVIRTTKYDVGIHPYHGRADLVAPIGVLPFRWNEAVPIHNYVTAAVSGPRAGAAFRVRTWPRGGRECMPSNNPDRYQKIILQAPGGAYLTTDESGFYHASANEAGACVFCLDLTRGTQTVLFHMFYRYYQRAEIDPLLHTRADRIGSYTARFVKPSSPQPILLGFDQGIGDSAVITIDMMHPTGGTIAEGIRLRDPVDRAVFVALEGALRHIPNPATYANLYRSDLGVTDIAYGYAYTVGTPLTDGAYLARGAEGRVFLVSHDVKRWIPTSVFERFEFDWNKVRDLPPDVLAAVPESATMV